jgi:hypothetical protein
MARRILIIAAASVVSLALCLFLALVLEWPTIFVSTVGMAPLYVAAAVAFGGSSGRDRGDGRG